MELKVTVGAGVTLSLPNTVNYFKYNFNIEYPVQVSETNTHKDNFKLIKKVENALNKTIAQEIKKIINNPEEFVGEENVKENFNTDFDL